MEALPYTDEGSKKRGREDDDVCPFEANEARQTDIVADWQPGRVKKKDTQVMLPD